MVINQKLKLVIFSLGLFVCHCTFGIIQERLFTVKYENGTKSEYFTFSVTFVAIQSIFYASFAIGEVIADKPRENLAIIQSIHYEN